MPIYNAPNLNIDSSETRRYAGLHSNSPFPEPLLTVACITARTLVSPRGTWQIYPYDTCRNAILSSPPVTLCGNAITSHLTGVTMIAVMAVTIGPQLEDQAAASFAKGEYVTGLLLDAAGSAAVESLADAVNREITRQAAYSGKTTVTRFSPGYGDWDVRIQNQIASLAHSDAIGLTVTPSCMLLPRKSITAVIGIMPGDHCPLVKNCCADCNQYNCLARKEN